MNVQVIGCSHRGTPIAIREKLAFALERLADGLDRWSRKFPDTEVVLLSTCNRVEIYTASPQDAMPTLEGAVDFLGDFHNLPAAEIRPYLNLLDGRAAVEHLFTVACSLDSMVLGESQILNQVKLAYQTALERGCTGAILNSAFQASLLAARRVAAETAIHQRRVSVPSVAVADFARRIFERFDNKHAVVIGAGEMAEETLRYLRNEGAHQISIVNRRFERAEELARQWHGKPVAWDQLTEALATADLVISTTGASEPIVALDQFERIERARTPRPMFILDLAVPRDFDPAIGRRPDVFLYSIDDLQAACERNRRDREKELPAAHRIIAQEAGRFMTELFHRATTPVIRRLKDDWENIKEEELQRLLNKLPDLDQRRQEEIRLAFDRLVNKLLHPPLESLRDESRHGVPHKLLESLAKLFQLKD
jgi:glutamyl-tRNA reductase